MTTLSVFTQDQLLSDSSTIHSGDTIASTGVGPEVPVPGASENAPESPRVPGDPGFVSAVPASAGPGAEIAIRVPDFARIRVPDFARLDFAQEDTVFLIDTARGSFKGVRRSGDFEVNPEAVRALAPGDAPRFRIPRAGDVHDILPDGPDEGYQTS